MATFARTLSRVRGGGQSAFGRTRNALGTATRRGLSPASRRAIQPTNIVWIFGFGRSGSTWLSSLMGEMEGHTVWQEPAVGALFGNFYYEDAWIGEAHHNSPSFILGARRDIWLRLIRAFCFFP